MTRDLLLAGLAYLVLLFFIAEAAERGWIFGRWVSHPWVGAAALGVYATSWTFFGSVGLAQREGPLYLTIYFGPTLACLLIPVIWWRIAQLVKRHQLHSLADLFAFRYQSHATGILVTLLMLASSLPYIALQIRAVAESAALLTGEASTGAALLFCGIVAAFAVLFGVRQESPARQQPGLVAAIAFESVVKVVALAAVAILGMSYLGDLSSWLDAHPAAEAHFTGPRAPQSWGSLTLLSFAAAFLLPRQFHLAFAVRPSRETLKTAMWLFPAILLLLSVVVPPLMWTGQTLAPDAAPDTWVLRVAATHPGVGILAFLGGLSASSAMVVVDSLALGSMTTNHLLLPVWRPAGDWVLRVKWLRRAAVLAVIAAGYVFYSLETHAQGLAELGTAAFVAIAQCLPGLLGLLFWPRATRVGVSLGLSWGAALWLLVVLFPFLGVEGPLHLAQAWINQIEPAWTARWDLALGITLIPNFFLFAAGSLLFRQTAEEYQTALRCTEAPSAPQDAPNEAAWLDILAPFLGPQAAAHELQRASAGLISPLSMSDRALLAERLESNLSGLLGPVLARAIVGRAPAGTAALAAQIRFHEDRSAPMNLQGPALQLDVIRRYLSQVLDQLPMGLVAVDGQHQIVLWNQAMSRISGQNVAQAAGRDLEELGSLGQALIPWLTEPAPPDELNFGTQTFMIARTALDDNGWILLIEDVSRERALRARIAHEDRLLSVGRLAAGVAHEIGNPLAGILILAKNLANEDNPEDLPERLGLIVHEAERISSIVGSLLTYSRAEPLRPVVASQVAVAQAVEEAVQLVRLSKKRNAAPISVECPPNLTVKARLSPLVQIIVNLLTNALDVSGAEDPIEIRATRQQNRILLTVRDHGPGLPPEVEARIFEPFFTTKPPGAGTGLGLTVVRNLVDELHGEIRIEHPSERGTLFVVELPGED